MDVLVSIYLFHIGRTLVQYLCIGLQPHQISKFRKKLAYRFYVNPRFLILPLKQTRLFQHNRNRRFETSP